MAEAESIICIFCGGRANIKTLNDQKIVSCPKCMRDTELDKYQDGFDLWLGDIRNEE
jgi:hypothetical protein